MYKISVLEGWSILRLFFPLVLPLCRDFGYQRKISSPGKKWCFYVSCLVLFNVVSCYLCVLLHFVVCLQYVV